MSSLREEIIGDARLILGDCRDFICAQTIAPWGGLASVPQS